MYLWSGLWPCTPHALETLAEFPPLQLHCGARPPRPGVVNPSEHSARKLNVFNAAPSYHAESCNSEPWRRAAPRLRRPFSPVTTSRSAPSLYHDTASRLLPFMPHPARRRAFHCLVASSALACAPVLRRPFSPLPRRWSCALRVSAANPHLLRFSLI